MIWFADFRLDLRVSRPHKLFSWPEPDMGPCFTMYHHKVTNRSIQRRSATRPEITIPQLRDFHQATLLMPELKAEVHPA